MTMRVSAPPKRNRSARQSGAVRGAGHHQTGPPPPAEDLGCACRAGWSFVPITAAPWRDAAISAPRVPSRHSPGLQGSARESLPRAPGGAARDPSITREATNVGAPPHLRRNHVFKAAIAHLCRRDCTASGAIGGAFLVSRPLLQQSGLLSCRQGAASVRWEPRALAWRRCRTGPAVIPDRGKPGWQAAFLRLRERLGPRSAVRVPACRVVKPCLDDLRTTAVIGTGLKTSAAQQLRQLSGLSIGSVE
jgi:hypothetical protein